MATWWVARNKASYHKRASMYVLSRTRLKARSPETYPNGVWWFPACKGDHFIILTIAWAATLCLPTLKPGEGAVKVELMVKVRRIG